MLKLKGVLSRALRRMREGPLPEVREVDWSEWEQSVAAWDDSTRQPPDTSAVPSDFAGTDEPPPARFSEVVERDWTVWEESVRAIERARRGRTGGE